MSFASTLLPDIHVIGDAVLGGAIPKSASAAVAQGRACAASILALFRGERPPVQRLGSICYDVVAPDYAFSLAGAYLPKDDIFVEVEGATSPVDAASDTRAREAGEAQRWYETITTESFG